MHWECEKPTVLNHFAGSLPDWFHAPTPVLEEKYTRISNAFVSRGSIEGWPRKLFSTVTDGRLQEVDESIFKRGYRVSIPEPNLIDQVRDATRLGGEYLYLGWMISHYGHFLTESLSRFWYLAKHSISNDTKYLLHANFKTPDQFPIHVKAIFEQFDIPLENIVIATQPYLCDSLVVPAPSILLDLAVGRHGSDVWNYLSDRVEAETLQTNPLFLSRSRYKQGGADRSYNDEEVESIFRNHGFEILYPEEFSFTEQIRLFRHSRLIAGPVGSAMHNAAFMPKGSQLLILAPNSFLFKNDYLISLAKQHNLHYILSDVGTAKIERKQYHFDPVVLEQSLQQIRM